MKKAIEMASYAVAALVVGWMISALLGDYRENKALKSELEALRKENSELRAASVPRKNETGKAESTPAKEETSARGEKGSRPSKNTYLKATPETCQKVSNLTRDYLADLATDLKVPASSLNFLRVEKDCMMLVDTPSSPKRCAIAGVIWLTSGEYVATNLLERAEGGLIKAGGCLIY